MMVGGVLTMSAQLPPSNMYDHLGVYKSVAVFEDGEQVPFTGVDYFYLDFADDGNIYIVSWSDYGGGQWSTGAADYVGNTGDGYKYEGCNGNLEDLVFILSYDKNSLVMAKENSDLVVAYQLANGGGGSYGGGYSVPSYGGSYGGSSGSYSGSSGSSSSGRTCISCSGSGKCKTCGGTGWYYRDSYYTGSGRTPTDCAICKGNGKCGTCYGLGTIR